MSDDWIEILSTDLKSQDAVRFVRDGAAGGIAVFLGTTREEQNATGQALVALDYEAYEEMALGQLKALANQARAKWPICKLVILHRIGQVNIAEPSVVIAVSTPHRKAAFEACEFLIDSLKADTAIWKKEVWADGGSSWVHPEKQ